MNVRLANTQRIFFARLQSFNILFNKTNFGDLCADVRTGTEKKGGERKWRREEREG